MAQSLAVVPKDFTSSVYGELESAENIIFFQWDMTADTFKLRKSCSRHRYALPTKFTRASTHLALDGLVHPDDVVMLEYYLHHIYKNRTKACKHHHVSARLRLRSSKKPLWLWSEIHMVTYYNAQQPAMTFGSIRNIQAEKLWQERIYRRANMDDLTGLLGKGAVKKQIRSTLRRLSPERDTASLLIVDADDFKAVNDSFGHLFGDKVLQAIGQAINQNFRQSDIKGRIGGDEFIILLPGMKNTEVLSRHCYSLCRRLSRVFHGQGKHQAFSISIGAAQFPDHGQSYRELFTHADHALYEAKRHGKGQYALYHAGLSETADTAPTNTLTTTPAITESETVADLQAQVKELQQTISDMGKLMYFMLQAKTN